MLGGLVKRGLEDGVAFRYCATPSVPWKDTQRPVGIFRLNPWRELIDVTLMLHFTSVLFP
jgi:hypothetical protein